MTQETGRKGSHYKTQQQSVQNSFKKDFKLLNTELLWLELTRLEENLEVALKNAVAAVNVQSN